jgi:hypothetical protein
MNSKAAAPLKTRHFYIWYDCRKWPQIGHEIVPRLQHPIAKFAVITTFFLAFSAACRTFTHIRLSFGSKESFGLTGKKQTIED